MGREMSKILPGLYLGRLDNAQSDSEMMANCITHVLSVHEPVRQKLQKLKSYEYFEVNVKDEETACISKYFCKTNDFIHEARIKNGNVLIHCLAGVSRAPAIVLAYLMTVYELSFQSAYNCLKFIRPGINPNSNFVKQLNDFETNSVTNERERLFSVFGIFQNLQEDKKILEQYIIQYENRENDDLGSSINSTTSDLYFNDLSSSNHCHRPLSNHLDNVNFLSSNVDDRMRETSPDHQSDVEEEIDIPGSIPIGFHHSKNLYSATSSSDYRGRIHSRASATADSNPILNRYGQTAPPTVPFLQDSE